MLISRCSVDLFPSERIRLITSERFDEDQMSVMVDYFGLECHDSHVSSNPLISSTPNLKGTNMFKRGDIVEILEEFQDPGDNTFTWMVLHDEEKERVDITLIDIKLDIKPTYTLKADQIKLVVSKPVTERTQ